jgi:hypothetical protein
MGGKTRREPGLVFVGRSVGIGSSVEIILVLVTVIPNQAGIVWYDWDFFGALRTVFGQLLSFLAANHVLECCDSNGKERSG